MDELPELSPMEVSDSAIANAAAAQEKIAKLEAAVARLEAAQTSDIANRAQAEKAANQAVVFATSDLIHLIVTGSSNVFVGAGLGSVEADFLRTTSPWADPDLRNGFDKMKDVTDPLGQMLVGAALVFKPADTKMALGISGVAALAIPAIIKLFGMGTNEDDVTRLLSNQLGDPQSDLYKSIAQISLSRNAYDEVAIHKAMFTRYNTAASSILDKLADLNKRGVDLRETLVMRSKPLDDAKRVELRALVDDVIAVTIEYGQVADFVEQYSAELAELYLRYSSEFPKLKDALLAEREKVVQFRKTYEEKVKVPFLSQIPTLKEKLFRWRLAQS